MLLLARRGGGGSNHGVSRTPNQTSGRSSQWTEVFKEVFANQPHTISFFLSFSSSEFFNELLLSEPTTTIEKFLLCSADSPSPTYEPFTCESSLLIKLQVKPNKSELAQPCSAIPVPLLSSDSPMQALFSTSGRVCQPSQRRLLLLW